MATSQSQHRTSAPSRTRAFITDFRNHAGLGAVIFTLPYVVLLGWFHGIDVYHRHFSDSGIIVLAYNCFRLLFIFYLFCIIAVVGWFLLRAFTRRELAQTGALERITLCFFAGAGLWHLVMLGLGYLGLYTFPVAILITLPIVALAFAPARIAAAEIIRNYKAATSGDHTGLRRPGVVAIGTVAIFLTLLLIVKGLYPGGGHDYFTHYFYYFETVIARGNVWPNDVWYHYYYDKGLGLTFLSMLLTDPLAPQLVTFCFMAAAALVMFLACRDVAPGTYWPWVAPLLFLIIFIYTPGWGEFEKSHELTTSLVIAALWAAGGALARCGDKENRLWPLVTGLIITANVIAAPTIAVLLGGVFALMSLWYLVIGQRRRAGISFLFGAVTGVLLGGTFALNYVTTGLVTDQLLLATWRITDVEKLHRWGALPMVLQQYWGLAAMVATKLKLSEIPKLVIQSARFDLLYPLADCAALIAVIAAAFRFRTGRWAGAINAPHQTGILIAALPVFIAIAMTAGIVQPISFYRYTGFAIPLVLVAAVGLWSSPLPQPEGRFARLVNHKYSPLVILLLCLMTFAHATPPGRFFRIVLPNTLRYAAGRYSIDTAYTLQPPTPLYAVNAINPGARGAYAVAGPGTPIWSMHYLSYCMLPDCRIESLYSFILPGWYEVMFGGAAEARAALQASGLDYFLVSRDLPLEDALPLSELFSPDHIAQYLGVKWTDGTTTLLTWLGPGVTPLDQDWLATYRRAVDESQTVHRYPYAAMKQIFARLHATPHPWRSFPLPW